MSKLIPRFLTTFQTKIILLVLAIMILSQSLGMFLSVLTFEKIYLKTLTSKYEILGKDLKRQIEKSLKFGKSLERFMGMERLVRPLYKDAPELHAVFMMDQAGNILFPGKTAHKKEAFIEEDPLYWEGGKAAIRVYGDMYHVLLPVIPPYGGQKGILDLVFSRLVVERKIGEMIRGMIFKLITFLVLTSIFIGLMIKFIVINPVRNQVKSAGDLFFKDPKAAMEIELPEEFFEVQLNGIAFVAKTKISKFELNNQLDELAESYDFSEETEAQYRTMKRILAGKESEKT